MTRELARYGMCSDTQLRNMLQMLERSYQLYQQRVVFGSVCGLVMFAHVRLFVRDVPRVAWGPTACADFAAVIMQVSHTITAQELWAYLSARRNSGSLDSRTCSQIRSGLYNTTASL